MHCTVYTVQCYVQCTLMHSNHLNLSKTINKRPLTKHLAPPLNVNLNTITADGGEMCMGESSTVKNLLGSKVYNVMVQRGSE